MTQHPLNAPTQLTESGPVSLLHDDARQRAAAPRASRTAHRARKLVSLATFPLLVALACSRPEPRAAEEQDVQGYGPTATAGVEKEGTVAAEEAADSANSGATMLESAPAQATAPPVPAAGAASRNASALDQRAQKRKVGAYRAGPGPGVEAAVARPTPRVDSGPIVVAPPAPEHNTEAYAALVDRAFVSVADQPLSTFSSDVDTASYSNGRRFLFSGQLPPKDSIRVEEWLNYFSYSYPAPTGNQPVAISSEVSSCPWNDDHRLVRVGLKARPIASHQMGPRNLVFLLDVSGSMNSPDKLPLLKQGMTALVRNLEANDTVSIVVYAGASGVVLPPTSATQRSKILEALESLESGGSTNGGEGIRLAYSLAKQHVNKQGINRVILATDGDFNVGTTSEGDLTRLIEEQRKSGVFLTVLGFGSGNLKDSTMEMLADKGNGNYAYIDSMAEAHKVLVKEAGSTLVTVAKDVKLQIEFNPARVHSYRLIGYENRALANEDFNNDKKDAGDMGAGHTVTALYEVVPVGAPSPAGSAPSVDPLRYQAAGGLSPAASAAELMTVKVRYKAPDSNRSDKISHSIADAERPFAQSSGDQRFAATVAHFAQVLRGTPALQGATLADTRRLAQLAQLERGPQERREFLKLLDRAQALN